MENTKFRSGTSVTTLLLILMTVTLTVVAVLSLASARQDAKLTERSVDMAEMYYSARSNAEKELYRMAADGAEGEVSFTEDAGADRELVVTATIENGRIAKRSFVLTDTMEYEDELEFPELAVPGKQD